MHIFFSTTFRLQFTTIFNIKCIYIHMHSALLNSTCKLQFCDLSPIKLHLHQITFHFVIFLIPCAFQHLNPQIDSLLHALFLNGDTLTCPLLPPSHASTMKCSFVLLTTNVSFLAFCWCVDFAGVCSRRRAVGRDFVGGREAGPRLYNSQDARQCSRDLPQASTGCRHYRCTL